MFVDIIISLHEKHNYVLIKFMPYSS